MGRPVGDACLCVVDQQVVLDQRVPGQGGLQWHMDQMHEGLRAHLDDITLVGSQTLHSLRVT